MRAFFTIAWRNIWRNRRRTILTLGAIAFSIAITIFMIALNDGSHDALVRYAIRMFSGYVQIHKDGYQKDPAVEKCFEYTEDLQKRIASIRDIKAFAPRLQTGALFASENNSVGGLIVGIEPDMEREVSIISQKVVKGEFLKSGDSGKCLIGDKLAKNLDVKLGSKVVLLTQGINGSTGAGKYEITGIFKAGVDEMDRNMVFITLSDAQDLLAAYGRVHMIVINTDSPRSVDGIVASLGWNLAGGGYEVLGWKELIPGIVQMIQLDDIFGNVFFALLLLVVIFGILSSVMASVLNRTHEFGLMMALGTRPGQIIELIILESFFIISVGLLLGLFVGLFVSWYFVFHPINLPAGTESVTSQYGAENKIYFAIYPVKIAITGIFLVGLTLLFCLYPAVKASQLNPDEALRSLNQ